MEDQAVANSPATADYQVSLRLCCGRSLEADGSAAQVVGSQFDLPVLGLEALHVLLQRGEQRFGVLRQAIAFSPENGEAYYSLGLLLAEDDRVSEAVDELASAARLLPRARVLYNYGIALQQLGRLAEAEDALLAGEKLSPRDTALVERLEAEDR